MKGKMMYSDMLIEVGRKQAAMCNDNSVTYINCLMSCDGMRSLMATVYCSLVSAKKVVKIENLAVEEKNTLWLQTKEFADNKLNLQETIKLSKCLYTIEYFLNNNL